MPMTEKNIRRVILAFAIFLIFCTILLEYAFNITLFRLLVIIAINMTLTFLLAYFYIHPSWLIKRRREIFLLFVSLLIFFALMETFLRINSCGWKWDISPEGDIKYKYESSTKICNSIIDGKRFYRETNNEGFIDDNFNYSKDDYTIFLVGDSYAACLESDYNNCVHQKLEDDLKEEYGPEINIMNFGVSSYGGLPELAVIKKYTDIYKPKMIILYFYVNDIQENQDYLNKVYIRTKSQEMVRKITPKTFLFFFTNGKNIFDKVFMKFDFYRKLSGLEAQAVEGREVYLKEYPPEWQDKINMELQVLDEVYNITSEKNITLLHVAVTAAEQVYPELWMKYFENYPSLDPYDYDSSKPNQIIMNYSQSNGVYNLDLLPRFRENPNKLHWVEGHWNDAGQLFAEQEIKEYILDNNLIKI